MRTQLDKGIWAIALLATLGFPGTAWAPPPPECPRLPLNFTDSQYTACFTDVRRGADINDDNALDLGGTGHTALNFTGGAGPAGDTWLTKYTPNGATRIFNGRDVVCMSADVLIHTYNNAKGAGLVALINIEDTECLATSCLSDGVLAGKALAVILYDQGNSDALQLVTIDVATGKITKLQTVSLGANIAENVWYHIEMSFFASEVADLLDVGASVFKHATQTDPNSPLVGRVGPSLSFEGSLSALGLDDSGEVGIAASAFSTNVSSSVTNWFAGGCVT